MKKKILATAITAATAGLVSTGVYAAAGEQVLSSNGSALIVPGGSSVMANDIVVTDGTGGGADFVATKTVVLRLPSGMDFAAGTTPTVTSDGTLFLLDSVGDPTQGLPGVAAAISLSDSDGNGLDDRIQVTVATDSTDDTDSLTFGNMEVVAGASVTAGAKNASVFSAQTPVTGGAAPTVATAQAVLVEPLNQQVAALPAVARLTKDDVDFSSAESELILTVPAGTSKASTIVLTFDAGIEAGTTGGSLMTATGLTIDAPVLGDAVISAHPTTKALVATFTTGGADYTEDAQYSIATKTGAETIDVVAPATAGILGVTLSGTAGLTGSANVLNLADNGTSVALTDSKAALTKLVSGADQSQALPDVSVTPVFSDDLGVDTKVITVTAETGLVFDTTSTVTAECAVSSNAQAVGAIGASSFEITMQAADCDDNALVISGLEATASATASGGLGLVLTGDATTFTKNISVDVAETTAAGTVTVAGPLAADIEKLGPGGSGSADITLTESEYGAIATTTQNPYIRVTPDVAGVTITGVTSDTAGAAAGELKILNANEAIPADGSWVLEVEQESTTKSVGTLTVGYDVGATVALGTDITFTVSSDVGASGHVTLGTVTNTTVTTVGQRMAYAAGPTKVTGATITITENFNDALAADGKMRLVAPTGVTFDSADTATDTTITGSASSALATTFLPNDTLLVTLGAGDAGASEVLTITPSIFIAPNAEPGVITVSLVDGQSDGTVKSNVTTGSIDIAYNGVLDALSAGTAITVSEGFSFTNTISGGLEGDGFSGTPADTDVASVTVDGHSLKVTGLDVGTTSVTVKDSLGASSSVAVTVVAASSSTELGGLRKSDGSTTTAKLKAGASSDGGATYATEFTDGDAVQIVGTVEPEAEHVGEAGDVYVVVRTIGVDGAPDSWSYRDADGGFEPWNGSIGTLTPAYQVEALASTQDFVMYDDAIPAGDHRFFIGYRVGDESDPVIYNGLGHRLIVSE